MKICQWEGSFILLPQPLAQVYKCQAEDRRMEGQRDVAGKGERGGGLAARAVPLPGTVSPGPSHRWVPPWCCARELPAQRWGHPRGPRRGHRPWLCPEGISAASSAGCRSAKELEALLKPDESLPLPALGGGRVVLLARTTPARRAAPRDVPPSGVPGDGRAQGSPGQGRWPQPPGIAVPRARTLRPAAASRGMWGHSAGTALPGRRWVTGPARGWQPPPPALPAPRHRAVPTAPCEHPCPPAAPGRLHLLYWDNWFKRDCWVTNYGAY